MKRKIHSSKWPSSTILTTSTNSSSSPSSNTTLNDNGDQHQRYRCHNNRHYVQYNRNKLKTKIILTNSKTIGSSSYSSMLIMLLIVWFTINLINTNNNGIECTNKVTEPGDILLGGLFPIHQKGRFIIQQSSIQCNAMQRYTSYVLYSVFVRSIVVVVGGDVIDVDHNESVPLYDDILYNLLFLVFYYGFARHMEFSYPRVEHLFS
ncbi:hypothetical protein BLOT_014357 [Blomia tropicalis]|nr:hypothetical protein BLOT_014357 [Blomia tropicalis]